MDVGIEWVVATKHRPEGTSCVLDGWANIDELIDLRDVFRSQIPGAQPLYILDNTQQAYYQSGHRTSDLWMTGEEDRTEYGAIMTRWLANEIAGTATDFDELLIPIDDPSIDLFGNLDDPDRVFVRPLDCWIIESPDCSMAIAAKPNGYFLGDLTPAQNYLLAEKLRQSHNLEIFGLGANFAAYCRAEPIALTEAEQMVEIVRPMYDSMSDDLANQWAIKTAGRRWFLVSYRGA